MEVDTVITGGSVVTPTEILEVEIAIGDGKVISLGPRESIPDEATVYDASGKLVLPGVVDPHVHIDSLGMEEGTYETETAAAAAGGVTTIIDFAWHTGVDPTDSSDPETNSGSLLDWIDHKRQNQDSALVDFSLHGILFGTDESVLGDIADAVAQGVTSFKMFTVYDIGVSTEFIHEAFEVISDHQAVALLHTEDPAICRYLRERLHAEGKGQTEWYPRSRPDYAEAVSAGAAIAMAKATGVKYYGVHTTSAEALKHFELHRDSDRIRGETCTHYTAFTEELYDDLGTLGMMSPPLRTGQDREALIAALKNSTLDVVSSDHVVFPKEAKEDRSWWDVPFGVNSLQAGLSVLHHELVIERNFTYPELVRLTSLNPARLFGLPQKGRIAPGADADIVIFDPDVTFNFDSSTNHSNADYSIYEGKELTGRVEQTFVRGVPVAENGAIIAEPGHGEFVERTVPSWTDV